MGTWGGIAMTDGKKGFCAQTNWHDGSLENMIRSIPDAGNPSNEKEFVDAVLGVESGWIDDEVNTGYDELNDTFRLYVEDKYNGNYMDFIKDNFSKKVIEKAKKDCEDEGFSLEEFVEEDPMEALEYYFDFQPSDIKEKLFSDIKSLTNAGTFSGYDCSDEIHADGYVIYNCGGPIKTKEGYTIPAKTWYAYPCRADYFDFKKTGEPEKLSFEDGTVIWSGNSDDSALWVDSASVKEGKRLKKSRSEEKTSKSITKDILGGRSIRASLR